MKESNQLSKTAGSEHAKVYTFGVKLSESTLTNNAHNQLYAALALLDDEWYQPTKNEERRVQFVQKQGALLCRSRVKPVGIGFKEEHITAREGDQVTINVRLPSVRRLKVGDRTRVRAIEPDDKEDYYSSLFERHGMKTDLIVWVKNEAKTIIFKKSGSRVIVPVDDVSAVVSVEDAKKFISAMQGGIGRYKTYGCGMVRVKNKAAPQKASKG